MKVYYENPFEDLHYHIRFGDEDRNRFTIEHELGLRKCRDGPWVTKGSYAEHYAIPNTTSLASETVLPFAQTPTSNELTESDMELLAASELQDAFTYSTTMPSPCSNHDELLLNEISCNEYEPTPTLQEFKEANMLSLEQWLSKTIP